jgi:hypothetical protein
MCSAIQLWTPGIMHTPCFFYFGPARSILPSTPQRGHLLSMWNPSLYLQFYDARSIGLI